MILGNGVTLIYQRKGEREWESRSTGRVEQNNQGGIIIESTDGTKEELGLDRISAWQIAYRLDQRPRPEHSLKIQADSQT